MTSPLLRVAICGLGERAAARLESFLGEIADDICEVVPLPQAQAVIVDLDAAGGGGIEILDAALDRPAIALAKRRPAIEGVVWVPKPIMEVALLEALNMARSALAGDTTLERDASDPSIPLAGYSLQLDVELGGGTQSAKATGAPGEEPTLTQRFFSLDDTLLVLVKEGMARAEERARQENGSESAQAVQVTLVDRHSLLIWPGVTDPGDAQVLCDFSLEQLSTYARSGPMRADCRVTLLPATDARDAHQALQGKPAVTRLQAGDLLWRLGVWSADGRMPRNLDEDKRLYLRCWPDLTRLMEIPHATRIAALWIRMAASSGSIARRLGVSIHDVNNFFVAAWALGIAGEARREDDYLLADRGRRSPEATRVAALVQHLGRNLFGGAV